jgi:hypothetical protein
LDTYHVVLYIHLLALFVGIGAGAVLLVCLLKLRAATTLESAVPWGMTAGQIVKAFPIAILGLFGSGAYMTSDVWTWSTGWIDVAIAGLVFLALNGPLVGGRAEHALKAALQANGPGELGEAARRAARHPGLWITECTNLAVVFAIVWNMTEKPGTGSAVAAVAVALAAGTAVGFLCSRPSPAPTADAVAEPAA